MTLSFWTFLRYLDPGALRMDPRVSGPLFSDSRGRFGLFKNQFDFLVDLKLKNNSGFFLLFFIRT